WSRGGWHEAAERVELAAELGEGDVMRGERHRLLLRPRVGRRIVLVSESLGLPAGREPAEDVELAARGRAVELLRRLGERGKLEPLARRLSVGGREGKHRHDQREAEGDSLHDRLLCTSTARPESAD